MSDHPEDRTDGVLCVIGNLRVGDGLKVTRTAEGIEIVGSGPSARVAMHHLAEELCGRGRGGKMRFQEADPWGIVVSEWNRAEEAMVERLASNIARTIENKAIGLDADLRPAPGGGGKTWAHRRAVRDAMAAGETVQIADRNGWRDADPWDAVAGECPVGRKAEEHRSGGFSHVRDINDANCVRCLDAHALNLDYFARGFALTPAQVVADKWQAQVARETKRPGKPGKE